VIQIRLGPLREVDPKSDPLGRARVGWHPSMSVDEVWDVARGTWVMKAVRVFDHKYVEVVNTDDTVICVAQLDGLRRAEDGRFELLGQPVFAKRVGKRTQYPHRTQNPVVYLDGIEQP
jgi:hypothetical protein